MDRYNGQVIKCCGEGNSFQKCRNLSWGLGMGRCLELPMETTPTLEYILRPDCPLNVCSITEVNGKLPDELALQLLNYPLQKGEQYPEVKEIIIVYKQDNK